MQPWQDAKKRLRAERLPHHTSQVVDCCGGAGGFPPQRPFGGLFPLACQLYVYALSRARFGPERPIARSLSYSRRWRTISETYRGGTSPALSGTDYMLWQYYQSNVEKCTYQRLVRVFTWANRRYPTIGLQDRKLELLAEVHVNIDGSE